MVDMAHIAGLVAAKLHPDPVPMSDLVTSTAHKTLRGPRSGFVLCKSKYAEVLDKKVFPGIQGGPLEHVIAGKAIAFGEALKPEFRTYAENIVANCRALADELIKKGWRLVSGGTDNHLILVDVYSKGLTGNIAEKALEQAGIIVNKNVIPFDPNPPLKPSGVRIGTPALTTRGMGEAEMRQIAGWIDEVLKAPADTDVLRRVRGKARDLCRGFPLPHG
jgi:glycine hydroxymethyltransferase